MTTPYLPCIGGVGGENGISQGTISYGASKDLILVHTVQLKPMIKAHFSGEMVASGISDVAFASVYSEKLSEEVDDENDDDDDDDDDDDFYY